MSYSGNSIADLIVTEPDGAVEPVAVLDDAVRQVKRYLVNTLGEPAVSGQIFNAIAAEGAAKDLPVGSVVPYAQTGTWTAPTLYLKCDGNTVGDVGSGAFYESADYEDLFNIVKKSYGNAGTESFAGGDTVLLPDFSELEILLSKEAAVANVSGIVGNGGSLSTTVTAVPVPGVLTTAIGQIDLSGLTLSSPLTSMTGLVFLLEAKGDASCTFQGMSAEISFDSGVNYLHVVESNADVFLTSSWKNIVTFLVPTFGAKSNLYVNTKSLITRSPAGGADARLTLQKAIGFSAQTINFIIKAK